MILKELGFMQLSISRNKKATSCYQHQDDEKFYVKGLLKIQS
jgi:hypothetical protein